jgi:predicted RNA-binding protein YlqC (UPF0109 family)
MEQTKKFLEAVLGEICTQPESLEIVQDIASQTLIIGCHDCDCGRVAGRGGGFLAALKTLANKRGVALKTKAYPAQRVPPGEYRGIGTIEKVREVIELVARQAFGNDVVCVVKPEGKHRCVSVQLDGPSVEHASLTVGAAFMLVTKTGLERHGQSPVVRLNLTPAEEAQPATADGRFAAEKDRN